jgi:hypothetical protein
MIVGYRYLFMSSATVPLIPSYPLFTRFLLLAAISILSLVGRAYSQDTKKPQEIASPEEIVQSMIKYFRLIDTLEFEVLKKIEVVNDARENFNCTLKYAGKGRCFQYTFAQHSNGRGDDDVLTNAFDGVRGYLLKQSNGELDITPSRNRDQDLANIQGFFEPFAFVLSKDNDGTAKGSFWLPTLGDYQDISTWSTFAEHLRSATLTRYGSNEAICVVTPGGVEPWTTAKTTFKVFLSTKAPYFPIAWERTGEEGGSKYVYEVKHLESITLPDNNETIVYPDIAIQDLSYGTDGADESKTTIQVQNVLVNRMKEENWAIDPARAKVIHDMTVKPPVFIAVPK